MANADVIMIMMGRLCLAVPDPDPCVAEMLMVLAGLLGGGADGDQRRALGGTVERVTWFLQPGDPSA
jgi:hypothetical protein